MISRADGEQGGKGRVAVCERGQRGHARDEQRPARVSEFGGAHGLTEAFGGRGGCESGEAEAPEFLRGGAVGRRPGWALSAYNRAEDGT